MAHARSARPLSLNQVAKAYAGETHYFDVESSRDLAKLEDPLLALEPLRGLVILDEVQRRAEILNWSELGRSMAVSDMTVRHYVDLLASTFMVRVLPPWHENLSKRQVKAPKVYIRDTGLLHTLLDIETAKQLDGHPKVGASWEGLCVETVIAQLRARTDRCYFWATHSGAELDLLVVRGGRRRGFEIKRTVAPRLTPSMQIAVRDLRLDSLDVIHAGSDSFPIAKGIRAVSLSQLVDEL